MEDFKNDIKEIKDTLNGLYDKVATHEAEAIIEAFLEELN